MLRDALRGGRRAGAFTLQWHLTNACEAHCRHCYDRSQPGVLPLPSALDLLRGFLVFCVGRGVAPRLCFTGGNPFLYPDFLELYAAAARSQTPISILGNPVSEALLVQIAALRRPAYYQVSLEGREAANDAVRGPGHFQRTLAFLDLLRRHRVRAHVMLTLTHANLDEVLPLGEALRGLADRFTFNRLARVGEAASLELPTPAAYQAFLEDYARAARGNPLLGLKDNLFNIHRHARGLRLAGGCTGHGCGAALNFLALLPTGKAHACRKFPSPVGNLLADGFDAVYDSAAARSYRRGCAECRGCPVRNHCGGCLAVTYGQGLDPLRQRDPYCFLPRAVAG